MAAVEFWSWKGRSVPPAILTTACPVRGAFFYGPRGFWSRKGEIRSPGNADNSASHEGASFYARRVLEPEGEIRSPGNTDNRQTL
ncbi:hypothetical protein NDU88_002301 [Pleurodeles waltl]|uniref:Uncharacterized protein n=1 Tax=Pleurodeles waltl TaxID=8319 RepID=A0AAV7WKU9_PLEWA|nr:hypothetical protein NDU88_002301 [Pleurodeles waltl]